MENTERQDHVDNSIMTLINELVPERYRNEQSGGTYPIKYDGGFVGPIRDAIQDMIRVKLNIAGHIFDPDEHRAYRKEFENAFYPFTEN